RSGGGWIRRARGPGRAARRGPAVHRAAGPTSAARSPRRWGPSARDGADRGTEGSKRLDLLQRLYRCAERRERFGLGDVVEALLRGRAAGCEGVEGGGEIEEARGPEIS